MVIKPRHDDRGGVGILRVLFANGQNEKEKWSWLKSYTKKKDRKAKLWPSRSEAVCQLIERWEKPNSKAGSYEAVGNGIRNRQQEI